MWQIAGPDWPRNARALYAEVVATMVVDTDRPDARPGRARDPRPADQPGSDEYRPRERRTPLLGRDRLRVAQQTARPGRSGHQGRSDLRRTLGRGRPGGFPAGRLREGRGAQHRGACRRGREDARGTGRVLAGVGRSRFHSRRPDHRCRWGSDHRSGRFRGGQLAARRAVPQHPHHRAGNGGRRGGRQDRYRPA